MHLARAFETVGISEGTRRLEVAESAVHYAADNTAGREAAPSTPTENSLRNMVAGIMKLDPRLIACDKPLLSLDIDSLVQLELTHAVKVRHGYDVSVEQYFDGLSIRMLAAEIEKRPAAGGAGTDLSPAAACAARAGASGVSPNMEMPVQKRTIRRRNMGLSLMFFSSDGSGGHTGRYAPILECARQADRAGFDAIWLPERHFHRFGGLYPNPSVLAAAVATVTERIRIRAGSVIIPLHDPIRVAEEWSMVDNLSGGRVDLGFGQGWNPNDFVLAPDNFPKRLACLHEGIATVKSLWSGAQIERRNGVGKQNCIGIFPPPVQRQLDTWITCSGGRERFIEAGASGANILTAMLFQDRNELADKLAAYREARASHGYNPTTGHVTLMLHTYVGTDMNEVRQTVRAPLMRYLEDSIDLWRQNFDKLDHLRQDDRGRVLEFAFERYFRSHSMCGTPEHCRTMAADMRAIGVDEIACLIDFGVAERDMLASLDLLKQLNDALVDVSDSGQVLRKTA
jgi:natural product biosynthesis luciferase-like monooxygenase protein